MSPDFEIDPELWAKVKLGPDFFAEIVREIIFGKNAQEDFHCSEALHNGADQYGRVFVDFDEERRDYVIRCMIWDACRKAQDRKTKQDK